MWGWCSLVAQCGAKSVHGFDIQEEMVELAKQATSHLDNVHIQVGDATDMPYDNTKCFMYVLNKKLNISQKLQRTSIA